MGVVSLTLKGLCPSTTYNCSVPAYNSIGPGPTVHKTVTMEDGSKKYHSFEIIIIIVAPISYQANDVTALHHQGQ